jgi:hypothetical protein
LSKKSVVYVGVALLVTLLFLSSFASGEAVDDKLSRVIRLKLGLDSEVYRVIETEYQGDKVVLVVIYGNEKAQNSSLGSDIKSGLRKYESESPVAISALTRNKDASFRPYALRVIQNGQSSQAKRIIGLTNGFKEGKMPEKVPIDGKEFYGSKGIITLGSSFDPTVPFRIKYGTTSAHFSLTPRQPRQKEEPEMAEATQETEDSGLKEPSGREEFNSSSETSEGKEFNSSAPISNRNSKSGQGMALLAQFGALLAITLSLL